MNTSQCTARLLASAVHDMRNVLAVIRESAGLAQDLAALADASGSGKTGGNSDAAAGQQRLGLALTEVQRSVGQGAALAEAMDYLAQSGGAESGEHGGPCDLVRVNRSFCLLAARQARAAQINLVSGESAEPVWAAVPPMDVLRALLEIFDLCASVGGQVQLRFTAGRRQKEEGIVVEVLEGANRELALAAMTGSPMLSGMRPGWRAALMPWREQGPRFFLSLSACDSDAA
ncbi:sensor histidine kinase [Desulfovibrio intestinalis]|uniref:Signal transduction histidine kinase n=1 Tax=Desulfovibrio intestinalis TaxID=58621 RepID=A0A7W8BYJ6_9BACT|nr:sensor histidine kinase [Desulfovibrio intestinalis]MBB5142330.1 signal transduction histidine kinase [Desulfovibrio intestinalis]